MIDKQDIGVTTSSASSLISDTQKLAAIVSNSDDAIISKTLAGVVTSWNAGATRMFDYTDHEMIGQSIDRIIPGDLAREEQEIIVRLTRGERIDHFDTVRIGKDARRIAVSMTISPLRDEAGNIVGASKVARDISERKRAEEAERAGVDALRIANQALLASNEALQRALIDAENTRRIKENTVESAPSAMVMINASGQMEIVNAQTERLFGYPRVEMLGQNVEMLIPTRFRHRHPEQRASFFGKPQSRPMGAGRDLFGLHKDGSEFPIEIDLNPIETSEGVAMVMSAIVDITSRKLAEEELRHANELAQIARIEAESANQAKTEFLAVMSHEIRTPLACISGYVDLLTNKTELTDLQHRYVELVKSANAALLTIVNDILDFSKVEAGQLELELRPFSPLTLIQHTVAIVEPAARAKSLSVNYVIEEGVPAWVMGDHARLRQVLLNLLNNAVKFTYNGAVTIDVCRQFAQDGSERIRFAVTDTGIGIPADQQHRLFKQFSQADSSVSRVHGGTGLGLAICKRLVELMAGEIGIISEVNHGSTVWFTVVMPSVAEPAPEPKIEASIRASSEASPRILVIDDIDMNLEIVEAYLEEQGYQVDCVNNALEAIEMVGRRRYDLILMDIQMPVMDGITATKRIRALSATVRDIPIIAMTGNVLPQQVQSFLEAGMNAHVGKPIERTKLFSNVQRWLPTGQDAHPLTGPDSTKSDRSKFDEFVITIGREKAERIAEKFLVSLTGAFKSTAAEALLEAHGLINTAGVIGLSGFVETCRHVAESLPTNAPDRGRLILEELRRAQSVARYTMTSHLLPQLRDIKNMQIRESV